jgi:hypothetical protein
MATKAKGLELVVRDLQERLKECESRNQELLKLLLQLRQQLQPDGPIALVDDEGFIKAYLKGEES